MKNSNEKKPHIISLMLLSAFAVMGAIVLTPALPEVSTFFGTTIGITQLTVTIFLLGYAGGQLIYGPIANKFGRKPALYLGIIIATIGTLFSIIASPVESFHLLLIGRLLEALGSSAGLVVSYTVINDYFNKEQARSLTAMLMLAFAIVPGVAVLAGGLIAQYLDWQSCFYFLLVYGLLLIIPIWRLPETIKQKDPHALKTKQLFKKYLTELKNIRLIGFAMCSGLSSACIYVFGAEGPFIGIKLLHIQPGAYGLWGLIPYVGVFIGSLIVIKYAKLDAMLLLKIAFTFEIIATIIMFVLFIFHYITIWTLLGPMTLFCIGHPILAGTALSMAMQEASDKSNGSAIMNFTAMSLPVIITLLLGVLNIEAAWILPTMFFVSLILMIFTFGICLRK